MLRLWAYIIGAFRRRVCRPVPTTVVLCSYNGVQILDATQAVEAAKRLKLEIAELQGRLDAYRAGGLNADSATVSAAIISWTTDKQSRETELKAIAKVFPGAVRRKVPCSTAG